MVEDCALPTRKLTKRVIDSLPSRNRVYIAYDDSLPGFGCRVLPSGSRSWIVEYRPNGGGRGVAKKRITLAPVSVLTPDQAREAAGDVLAAVRLGQDIPHDRATRRSASRMVDLVERFMREEVQPTRKPRTTSLYELYFRLHILPALGDKRAREITASDIAQLHRKIGAKTPAGAR